MVPELAAGMRSGSACASARRSVSTMRCDVSTLPPATAAGGDGVYDAALGREDLHGAHETGCRDGARRQQAAEDIKDCGPGDGVDGVEAAGSLRICSGEVHDGATTRGIVANGDANGDGAGEHSVVVEEVFGVPLASGHVCEDFAHQASRSLAPSLALLEAAGRGRSGDHSTIRVAPMRQAPSCAVRSPSRSFGVRTLARMSARICVSILPACMSLTGGMRIPSCAISRHGPMEPGIHSADVGVMGAIGDVEGGASAAAQKDGRDHGDVGQMGSATIGIVEKSHIAGRETERRENRGDRHRHRSQVDRHVVAHGDQFSVGGEDCGGVVAALFDVGRKRGAAKGRAHLDRDGMERVADDGRSSAGSGSASSSACLQCFVYWLPASRLPKPSTVADQPSATRWLH